MVEREAGQVPGRVYLGAGVQVLGRLVGAGTTAIALALLARHLGIDEFGRYTFYIGVFALLDALVDFGTSQVAVQLTANDAWALPGTLRVTRRIRLAMAALGLALVSLAVWWYDEPGGAWIAAAALYPATHALELSCLVWRNRIDFGRPVAIRAAAAIARLALIALVASSGAQGAALFVFVTALGSSLANFGLHLAARRELPKPSIGVAAPRGILARCWPLGLAALCQQAYFYADNWYVRELLGDVALGSYNAGVRLLSFAIMIAQYTSIAALPWLARERGPGATGRAAARLGAPLFALACVAAGALWPHAARLLELVYGPGYGSGAGALRWLLLAAAVIYAGSSFLTAVVALGETRTLLWIAASALALNLAANLFAVPTFGITGAGAVTLATEAWVALAALFVLRRRGQHPLAEHTLWWLAAPLLGLAAAMVSAALAR